MPDLTRSQPVVAVRAATVDDAAAVAALVHSAYRAEESRSGWTTEADLLGGQRVDAAMVRDLLGRSGSVVLLARHAETPGLQGRAVDGPDGAVADEPDGAPSAPILACCHLERRESGAYLGMLAVRPGLQGRGIGRTVLDAAQSWADVTWGGSELEITVLAQRPELIAWYERRGFVLTGERYDFPYGDERYGVPHRADLVLLAMRRSTVPPTT
ncbi:N-acetyltransferase [Cellulomonas sp. KRMCY2]|uniref:GNAT family N-acetyltransferase n=1 Tax=Cellulomonas sp. KRMCY2 TaxID=1304865 RepID=UPI00045E93D0|nr:GNAT family N-acetyltransferase [Cellulomonas sp. KRMCY2]